MMNCYTNCSASSILFGVTAGMQEPAEDPKIELGRGAEYNILVESCVARQHRGSDRTFAAAEERSLDVTLSVAMCTFNGAQFLGAQLSSIALQNRPPDELVVCDDGSSDGSIEIVAQFARRAMFPVRLIVNDTNLGSTKNFEKAISLCRGTIVALADQDDVWYQHKLARIERAFLQSSETVLVFSDADLIDDKSHSSGARLWPTFSFDRAEQMKCANGRAFNILLKHPVVTGASMAFLRDHVDILLPIPAKQIHDRWISFLLAATGKFEVISEALMQYRQHHAQQVGPGPRNLRERTQRARLMRAEGYLEEVERFHEFRQRLEELKGTLPCAAQSLEEIERKISHLQHRARLPASRVVRISGILRRILNGDYWRYSTGWSSIAKDLLIP
jgi:glycosyltransferase involved in cell wall biosynthesis